MIERPYQGIRTFCKIGDRAIASHKFAIVGAGVDSSTSFRAGARTAPAAIREASMMLLQGVHHRFPVDIKNYSNDLGDLNVTNCDTIKMLGQIESSITNILAWNKHPLILGGEHTITLGILRAMYKKYGKVAVVHFDSHSDTNATQYDELFGNNTWLYHAVNEGLIDVNKVITLGTRAPMTNDSRVWLTKQGGTTITTQHAFVPSGPSEQVPHKIAGIVGDTPCYLTIDISCLDPAYAPAASALSSGGFTTMWLLSCLEQMESINWIGMDIVEVSPPYDHSNITALAAATICWTYLSMNIHKSKRYPILPLTNEQASANLPQFPIEPGGNNAVATGTTL